MKSDEGNANNLPIYVIGSGGHAKTVVATVMAAGHKIHGIIDDNPSRVGQAVLGIPVIGGRERLKSEQDVCLLAIGSEKDRMSMASSLSVRWAIAAHPTAVIHDTVSISDGTVVFPGAVLQPDSQVGIHAIISSNVVLAHDAIVGDFSQLCPQAHLAGAAKVEEGVFVGAGVMVYPGVTVGAWSILAPGTIVTKDIPPNSLVVGLPGKVIRSAHESEVGRDHG